jgi:tetratricopeptide (TPR) repeat protein
MSDSQEDSGGEERGSPAADITAEMVASATAHEQHADGMYKRGNYTDARDEYMKAISICKGSQSYREARLESKVGCTLMLDNKLDAAIVHFLISLTIRDTKAETPSADTANVCFLIGDAYLKTAEQTSAIIYFQRALEIHEKLGGPTSVTAAMCLFHLAHAYEIWGRYARAYELYMQSLDMRVQLYGNKSLQVANAYAGLAGACLHMCDFDQALLHANAAHEIRIDLLGENTEAVASSHCTLGHVYIISGDLERALAHLQAAVEIRQRLHGASHLLTGNAYNNIGACFVALGHFFDAMLSLRHARDIIARIFGDMHPMMADVYINYGRLYHMSNDISRAIEFHTRAHTILTTRSNNQSASIAALLVELGEEYAKMGEDVRAKQYFKEGIAMYLEVVGPDHPYTLKAQESLQILQRASGASICAPAL